MFGKRLYFLCLLLISFSLFASEKNDPTYSIVFVHIGSTIPDYTKYALHQARLFNKDCPIYFLGNRAAAAQFSPLSKTFNVQFVEMETLPKGPYYEQFSRNHFLKGFWRVTIERFYALNLFLKQYQLQNVFHLENDNTIYENLGNLLSVFSTHYNCLAFPFENHLRAVPGIVFIPEAKNLEKLLLFWNESQNFLLGDMEGVSSFYTAFPEEIKYLPTLPEGYDKSFSIGRLPIHTSGSKNPEFNKRYNEHVRVALSTRDDQLFMNFSKEFNALFDGNAIGQFFGGYFTKKNPGYINPLSAFNPSTMQYVWEMDEEGRKVPYAIFNEKKWRLINLHIHAKTLEDFISKPYEN